MAAASGVLSGTTVSVFAKLDETVAGTATFADLTTGTGLAIAGNALSNVEEIGDITAEATVVTAGFFGEPIARRYVAQAVPGDLTLTVALDRSNSLHESLSDAGNLQKRIAIALLQRSGANDATVVVVNGFLGGQTLTNSTEDVSRLTLTISQDGRPIVKHQA